jgi:hypothetical protein
MSVELPANVVRPVQGEAEEKKGKPPLDLSLRAGSHKVVFEDPPASPDSQKVEEPIKMNGSLDVKLELTRQTDPNRSASLPLKRVQVVKEVILQDVGIKRKRVIRSPTPPPNSPISEDGELKSPDECEVDSLPDSDSEEEDMEQDIIID